MVIGRFITIEGGEGVGKSLFAAGLAASLQAKLAQRGLVVELGREPGGTPAAESIRSFWAKPPPDDPWLAMTELCLVSAARAQHVGRRIRPVLAAGNWYLCDRYADSSRVYQGQQGGLDPQAVEAVIAASTGGLAPDLTFILDCDVETAMARIARGRGDAAAVERYDQQDAAFHQRLRLGFLELERAFPRRIVRLDAAQPPADTVAAALAIIEERLLGCS